MARLDEEELENMDDSVQEIQGMQQTLFISVDETPKRVDEVDEVDEFPEEFYMRRYKEKNIENPSTTSTLKMKKPFLY